MRAMERHTPMKTFKTLMSAVAVLAVVAPGTAGAAGISLDLQSARGVAMAGSTIGFIDDASAIYYNPAGIAQGQGIDFMIGITGIVPFFNVTDAAGVETNGNHTLIPPPHIYLTYGISDEVTVGIGVFTPYGLSIGWPDGYPGRFIVTNVSQKLYDINPTVAFHFGPVRFAGGAQIVRATVELQRNINLGVSNPNVYTPPEPAVDLGASAWGFGGNAGIQIDLIEKVLQVGVSYRSAVVYNFNNGLASFTNIPPQFQGQLHDPPGNTSTETPTTVGLGLAWKPISCLTLDADVTYFGWQVFQSIALTFPQTPSLNSVEQKNWHHTWNYRVGAEWIVDEHWAIRAGILVDPTPGPTATLQPDVPDSTRINFAGGFGWRAGAFHVDLGAQWIYFLPITSGEVSTSPPLFNPASYNSNALVGTLSFEVKI
jgi:long-chain fatty acid transport protein